MNHKKSLRLKFILGFIIVTAPLIFFLFYNNFYAMNVVRTEVSQSYYTFLETQVKSLDQTLEDTSNYILRIGTSDLSYTNLIPLTLYPMDSGDYFMAKQWLLRKFSDDLSTYKGIETFFVYSKKNKDLFNVQNTYEDNQRFASVLFPFFQAAKQIDFQNWQIVMQNNKYYMIRVIQISPKEVNRELYVGALIDIESLLHPLQLSDLGHSGKELLLMSDKGIPLIQTSLSTGNVNVIMEKLNHKDSKYISFSKSSQRTKNLLIGFPFQHAAMSLAVIIPEKIVLQKLLYFQRLLYLIPLGLIIILAFYLFFVKQVLLKPMHILIKGMRSITRGDLDVRLDDNSTKEFSFLIETFNIMASQVSNLKINVYEEMLKVQKAEFNHLQAQINPHFYLNSLNIIFSLSVLEKNLLVQKMTEHLADYFRFITRTHRDTILLSEEIGHIENYLEIQKLRFPNKLMFAISIPEMYLQNNVFPLLIQPFVENAIIHGMDKGKAVFHIEIKAQPSEEAPDSYEVLIIDNGKGFTAEKLEQLQAGQYAEGHGSDDKHLGIWNVHHRLRMKYGRQVKILFENGIEKGAIIRLRIPNQMTGENQGGRLNV
ncbi:HAMP domain-containing protein [Paenibacillus psychroresistens]|uniref:HAMP domain-containing protein n=1 Tax=Paenibacillus psychroresistens TaxID=1778678 RepID=A0A6B8RUG4_9BACL|nr:histidine kinase [Paenibacillus psychroresistens]QGQ99404.1 HAMP domain-containing protein [Paenibacillus psychroresistens]